MQLDQAISCIPVNKQVEAWTVFEAILTANEGAQQSHHEGYIARILNLI